MRNQSYRLGAPGFLASEELTRHGIKPDRGLQDQVVAFTWLQRHIEGFGGDPLRVTAAGVSAGSSKMTSAMQAENDAYKLTRDN